LEEPSLIPEIFGAADTLVPNGACLPVAGLVLALDEADALPPAPRAPSPRPLRSGGIAAFGLRLPEEDEEERDEAGERDFSAPGGEDNRAPRLPRTRPLAVRDPEAAGVEVAALRDPVFAAWDAVGVFGAFEEDVWERGAAFPPLARPLVLVDADCLDALRIPAACRLAFQEPGGFDKMFRSVGRPLANKIYPVSCFLDCRL
jgi:hypothetical protein